MKVLQYAVTVSYGAGFHHFRAFKDERLEAVQLAEAIQAGLLNTWLAKPPTKRGARPATYVWEMQTKIG